MNSSMLYDWLLAVLLLISQRFTNLPGMFTASTWLLVLCTLFLTAVLPVFFTMFRVVVLLVTVRHPIPGEYSYNARTKQEGYMLLYSS